jgi:TPR repeat protein
LSSGCAAALLLTQAPARAQDAGLEALTAMAPLASFAGSPNLSLSQWVLPYAPYIFDIVVTFARSVAVITYQSRGYDPVTRDFVVRGLSIGREGVDVAIDRIRINAATQLYEGIAIDTRAIPMEAAARDTLKKLDAEIIRGDVVSSVVADIASASYDIDVKARFENIGALGLAAKVEGFHVLLPLDEVAAELEPPGTDGAMPAEPDAASEAPVLAGRLQSASLTYDDAGLTEIGFQIAAEAQQMTAGQLQGAIATMLVPMIASLFQDMPGGASPELMQRAVGWSGALQAYLADPQHIEIRFSPEEPFDLAQLKPGVALDETMILALNPEVSAEASEVTALVDPRSGAAIGADDLSLAERLVEGLGIPQDVKRGVALALSDIAAGQPEAAAIVVRGIVLDPDSAVTADTAASSYVLLLLAQARGTAVPEAILGAVRARLTPEQVAAQEKLALAQWRESDGEGQEGRESAAIEARDWGALRDLAFDYYEGAGVPRNVTRAFTFASVAAAGGDRIATTLRDDLLAGLRDKRLAFAPDVARADAAAIWQTIVTAAGEPAAAEKP